jgi:hypothetical protein
VGSVIVLCGRLVGVERLEHHRREHSDAGMAPFGVVPAFYPLEDRVGKRGPRFPSPGVEDLELQVPQNDFIIELS